jgi:hypothetical protein
MDSKLFQQTSQYKENEMESIDVHDLPEDDAQLIAAFVEFLRSRYKGQTKVQGTEIQAQAPQQDLNFAAWPLRTKGDLSREEIYDYL